jgi:hypothetical protein
VEFNRGVLVWAVPMYAEAFPEFDTYELRQMTLTFLHRIGFRLRDRIWIKMSWDLPPEAAPTWWKRFNRNGFTHLHHYVLCGRITPDGFRLWHCAAHGKDSHGVTRWRLTRKGYQDGWQFCFERSRQGATVVFYPNKPQEGIGNHHVRRSWCLFYEIDDQPLSAQLDALEDLTHETGLHPAATVFSGGRSLHVYLRTSKPLPPDDWLRLNRKLCILQNADPQICSLARAMRLPGMLRCKADQNGEPPAVVALKTASLAQYHPTEVESALDSTGLFPYGLDDARWRHWLRLTTQAETDTSINPHAALLEEDSMPLFVAATVDSEPYIQPVPPVRLQTGKSIPLIECLTYNDRNLIQHGCSEGSRNANGYKLARNLLGTAEFLDQQGIYYTPGDYRILFEMFSDRCTPPLAPAEREILWHSATSRSATPSRTPDSILNTVRYWQSQIEVQRPKPRQRTRRFRTHRPKQK